MKLKEATKRMRELSQMAEWLRLEMESKYAKLGGDDILVSVHFHHDSPTLSIFPVGQYTDDKYHIEQDGIAFIIDNQLKESPVVDIIISEILQMEA